ncbi:MAG: Thiamin-phosphate pyrophosphorylase (EC [uncultured Sulfurovum sp.]|uniref:Thiamin-phosphate pyrophosphorylase (EC) n=1 Tax=uncultured Sulfurovum sp. TaxID=269237 RepID=A0A6S6ST24_9BACT|nr:MAG: Thiamin-phosphate pyrophosphorylase (EC [uncultured Sulfurovum sp.]
MITYAITDPSTLNFQTLDTDIKRFFNKAGMIVYRDKSTDVYAKNARSFIEEAKKHSFQKILLHTDYELAHKLKADGVHLKSTQFNDIEKAKALNLFVIISTHSVEEAKEAEALGANMVTFSPIFTTPNKGEPKGVEALKELVSMVSIPIIALGGILTDEHIALCKENGAFGFASIRYFA